MLKLQHKPSCVEGDWGHGKGGRESGRVGSWEGDREERTETWDKS